MERLKVFDAYTLPVIRYYTEKGKLYKVLLLADDLRFFLTNTSFRNYKHCLCDLMLNVCQHNLKYHSVLKNGCQIMQINAIGTEDEIFERVRPIFAK